MYKRLIAASVAAALLPVWVYGQAIVPTPTQSATCAIVGEVLHLGSTGQSVTILQQLLVAEGFLHVQPTGYFGPLTRSALIQFQLRYGIIASASGGGIFGPLTSAFVQTHWCSGETNTPPPPPVFQCPMPPIVPSSPPCSGAWKKLLDSNQCHVGWVCTSPGSASTSTSQTSQLQITSITGPNTVSAGQGGDWKVQASNGGSSAISYSVVWGDEGQTLSQLLNIAQQGSGSFSSSNAFSHIYKTAGIFNAAFFARDTAGNDSKAVYLINVTTPFTNPTTYTPTTTTTTTTTNTSPGECSYTSGVYQVPKGGTAVDVYSPGTAVTTGCHITARVVENYPENHAAIIEFGIPLPMLQATVADPYRYMRLEFSHGQNNSGPFKLWPGTCPSADKPDAVATHFVMWGNSGSYYADVDPAGGNMCKFKIAVQGPGLFEARFIDPDVTCPIGALSCPGRVIDSVQYSLPDGWTSQ